MQNHMKLNPNNPFCPSPGEHWNRAPPGPSPTRQGQIQKNIFSKYRDSPTSYLGRMADLLVVLSSGLPKKRVKNCKKAMRTRVQHINVFEVDHEQYKNVLHLILDIVIFIVESMTN